MKTAVQSLLVILLTLTLAGCTENGQPAMNKTAGSAIAGTIIGAGTGAIIGSTTGNAGRGVAIGGALGGLSGAFLGNKSEKQDKQRQEFDERQRRQQDELDRQRREIEELKRQQSGDGYYRAPGGAPIGGVNTNQVDSYYRTPSSGSSTGNADQQKYDDVYRKY